MNWPWKRSLPPIAAPLGVTAFFLLAALAFWKFRIIDPATLARVSPQTGDLYAQSYPMSSYGFKLLGSGAIPFWNPYQLCGAPFLAEPLTGLFYPANLVYLLFETGAAAEVSLVMHLLLGGLGMWALGRALGFTSAGALASATTFIWSGFVFSRIHQPTLLSGVCWLPATLFLVEKSLRGSRSASWGLVLAIACQLLNGATEVFLYNMYAAALFTGFRLAPRIRAGASRTAARRAALLLGCVVAGVLLSSPQLLPSLELVGLSARAPGSLPLHSVLSPTYKGAIAPFDFLTRSLVSVGDVAVGFLPLFGLAFGLGSRRVANAWWFALTAAVTATLLISGGWAFEMYYDTPLGDLFRRPKKFLQIYALAQALMAGIALTRLEEWSSVRVRGGRLWSSVAWVAGLCLAGAGIAWLAFRGLVGGYLLGATALLVVFGLSGHAGLRRGVVVGLLLLQGANLFLGARNHSVRPAAQPQTFDRYANLLGELKQAVGHERIYLSPALPKPGLSLKQGVLQEVRVVVDYEPLCSRRADAFFRRVSGSNRPVCTNVMLGAESKWRMMDLTSTRYYLALAGSELDRFLEEASQQPERSGFELASRGQLVSVYERSGYLPRAYYVPRARVFGGPEQVLAELAAPRFESRGEVLLEAEPALESGPTRRSAGRAEVEIQVDEPERVAVEVRAPRRGFLVLTDSFYPGWRATANGREVPIYRANYLFRAVPVPAGGTRIVFEFRPDSFRAGLRVGAATAVVLLVVGIGSMRKRGRQT
ncbi:MAG: YfhO family protein [Myxococcota bacterium]